MTLPRPDPRQIDGLGGATTVTSKVAMVSPSQRPGIDVDYRFAQVWLDKAIVDTAPSCGNMLAGVGPFAIERGLVTPDADETRVRIFDVNTGSRIEAIVQTPGGTVTYAGDQRMDGVPGTAAPVVLSFSDVVGSKCGAMFPTGAVQEEIDGVAVSCIDVAVPMVMMRFVVLLDSVTPEQDKSFRSWLIENNVGYWHWLSHCWLINKGSSEQINASKIRDKAIELYDNTHVLVLELRGTADSDTWSGYGPKTEKRDMFKWLKSDWN